VYVPLDNIERTQALSPETLVRRFQRTGTPVIVQGLGDHRRARALADGAGARRALADVPLAAGRRRSARCSAAARSAARGRSVARTGRHPRHRGDDLAAACAAQAARLGLPVGGPGYHLADVERHDDARARIAASGGVRSDPRQRRALARR